MFTGFACIFSHLQGHQFTIGGQQGADTAFAIQRGGNIDQQLAHGAITHIIFFNNQVQQQFNPVQTLFQ